MICCVNNVSVSRVNKLNGKGHEDTPHGINLQLDEEGQVVFLQ